jgi:hypothetical protein
MSDKGKQVLYGIRFDMYKGDHRLEIKANPASIFLLGALNDMASRVMGLTRELEKTCEELKLEEFKDIPDEFMLPIYEQVEDAYRNLCRSMEMDGMFPLYGGLKFSWKFLTPQDGKYVIDFCCLSGRCSFGVPTIDES